MCLTHFQIHRVVEKEKSDHTKAVYFTHYLSATAPTVPGVVTLVVNTLQFLDSTLQLVSQSNMVIVFFSFDTPLIWNDSVHSATSIASFRNKSSKLGHSQKLTNHSLPYKSGGIPLIRFPIYKTENEKRKITVFLFEFCKFSKGKRK